MKIYSDESLKRRRLFSLPGLTISFLLLGTMCCVLLIGAIIGLRVAESPGLHGANRWLLDTYLSKRIVTPTIWNVSAMMGGGMTIPLNLLEGVVMADAEPMLLDIGWKDYQAITFQRKKALDEGILFASPDDYVKIRIRFRGERYTGKARLKGRMPDHWSTDKWSLKLKLDGDETLMGMKRFALQAPETRNFLSEWIALEMMRREGLLAVQYHFVDLTINGVSKGLFALEENFDKHVLERGRRREGPIIRFDNDASLRAYGARGDFEAGSGEYTASPIVARSKDNGHGSAVERAIGMLEAFRSGRMSARQVFHVERMATFLAIREIVGSLEIDWRDMRFYYDPIRSRLEPIGYDNHAGGKINRLFCHDGGIYSKSSKKTPESQRLPNFVRSLFQDRTFVAGYVAELERLSKKDAVEGFFKKLNKDLQQSLVNLHGEYPYASSTVGNMRYNAAFVRNLLGQINTLTAYSYAIDQDRMRVLVGNTQSLPIEIIGLTIGDADPIRPTEDLYFGSKRRAEPIQLRELTFMTPAGLKLDTLDPATLGITYRFVGSQREQSTKIHPWSIRPPGVSETDWTRDHTGFRKIDWLTIDEERKIITIRPGDWVLSDNLVIPPGYALVANAGVTLDLRDGANLISYSRLLFEGSPTDPIVVKSSDGTGQGVVVLDTFRQSKLRSVRFEGLGTPNQGGWSVPGSVTFYESDCVLEFVKFHGNRSEDALNVIRCKVEMQRVSFVDIQADAFDGDFVSGTLKDCTFLRCGNDGIDVSGSTLSIDGARFVQIGDKAISAGERSLVEAENIVILKTELGCTSKDASVLTIKNSLIEDTVVGFVAFQKKTEFSGGTIRTSKCRLKNVKEPYLIEKNSNLIRDGRWIKPNHKSVEPLLYGKKYGKSSK